MVDAGWFTDPESPTQLRWWDGQRWTEHRHAAMPATITVPPVEPMPAVVSPVVAAPVMTPPNQIYPAPAPLATSYPPPRVVESAPAESAPASTASYWQSPEPKPKSSRNLLLAVLIPMGTLILILIVFIAVNITEPTPASHPSFGPEPSVMKNFGTPTAPKGLTPVATLASTRTTAGAALAQGLTSFPEKSVTNPDCKALAYTMPVTAADKGSSDQLLVLPSYSSGGATPGIVVTATLREFASAESAQTTLGLMKHRFDECQNGYSNARGEVDVVGESASFGDTTNEAWEEFPAGAHQPVGEARGGVAYDTVDFFSGSSVLQLTCNYNDYTSDNVGLCLNWESELSDQYDRVH